ncbi:MAG: hypothetical protein IPG48_09425 [Saprospiraceae bacterium]|nr:hypothetical protein [Saprospiraceae bacterium]
MGGTYVGVQERQQHLLSVSIGTCSVTVTNNGCTAIGTRTLSVTSNQQSTTEQAPKRYVGGGSTFTASGERTYSWSTGANTASINVRRVLTQSL